ncbi:MAG TPA: hypothetical protein VGC80_15295, partial [Acetobacteraceae bacterium]
MATRRFMLAAALAALAALAITAPAQDLDPAVVRVVRFIMREEAVMVATHPNVPVIYDWQAVGVVHPKQEVTAAEIRKAFEGNAIQAERRFAEPYIVTGTLHSVSRRADRAIIVSLKEGGPADAMRRAFPSPGLPNMSDLTASIVHG